MGRGDPDAVALVVVQGGTNVPAINAMWGPSAMLIGFFMDNNAGAWRGERCAVEIKCALELGVGRKFGVESGWSE